MSVIEKLDSMLAKWQNGAVEADDAGERMEALALKDCADELDALMPAIRQAMIDAERYQMLRDDTFIDRCDIAALSDDEMDAALDAAIDAARATGEGEGNG